eukprot:g6613.t1
MLAALRQLGAPAVEQLGELQHMAAGRDVLRVQLASVSTELGLVEAKLAERTPGRTGAAEPRAAVAAPQGEQL